MTPYWWVLLLLTLLLVLAPVASFQERRAFGARRPVAVAADGHPATGSLAADFVWIGALLAGFLILMQLRVHT